MKDTGKNSIYLIDNGLREAGDDVLVCRGAKIRIKYWQSSPQTWRELAGRAGYCVICGACGEDLHFEMTAMN